MPPIDFLREALYREMDVRGAVLAEVIIEVYGVEKKASAHVDRKALAERLGVKVDAIHQAFSRLLKSGSLERSKDGGFAPCRTTDNRKTPDRTVSRSPVVKPLTEVSVPDRTVSLRLTEVSGRTDRSVRSTYKEKESSGEIAAAGARKPATPLDSDPPQATGLDDDELATLVFEAEASEWTEAADEVRMARLVKIAGRGADGAARVRHALAERRGAGVDDAMAVLTSSVKDMKAMGIVPKPPKSPAEAEAERKAAAEAKKAAEKAARDAELDRKLAAHFGPMGGTDE